jgi:hypothetical protein
LGSNSDLTNVDGLSSLTTVGGYFYIGFNPRLVSLQGLGSLTNCRDYLNIENNDELESLAGIDNLNLSNVSYIKIIDSEKLSLCTVKSVCYFLTLSSNALIYGNSPGCSSRYEIINSGACAQAMPVELISFTGENTPEGNKLVWKTAWETTNRGFGIEKSLNAIVFEEIAFVDGAGDSNVSNAYTFTDGTPEEVTYYRLRQVDLDATVSYSKIIAVRNNKKVGNQAISVYPNPSSGKLFISNNGAGVNYLILTQNGKEVKKGFVAKHEYIETSGLKNGIYLVKVDDMITKVLVNN